MINVYLCYNGNCEEAMRFYDKAFGTQHTICGRYKDAPPCDGTQITKEMDNYIMHGGIKLGENQELYFCDVPNGVPFNESINVSLAFETADKAKEVFAALSEGGKITEPIGEVFWSECYGSLVDKFGVNWMITVL